MLNTGKPSPGVTYGTNPGAGAGLAQAAPAPARGNLRYDANTGYAGAAFKDPNTWASDSDYNSYLQSQNKPGDSGRYLDSQGTYHYYAPSPQTTTNQYQTSAGPGGHTSVAGQGTISPEAYYQQQQTQLESELGQQGWDHRLNAIQGLIGSGPGGGTPPVSQDMSKEEKAARDAAFARAKDMTSQNSRAAMDALTSQMSERGLLGSGYESAGRGAVIAGAQGQIGDFNREQLIQDLNRSASIADSRYQGNITQRGQDIQRQMALLGLLNSGVRF